jgi:hypothetical protein
MISQVNSYNQLIDNASDSVLKQNFPTILFSSLWPRLNEEYPEV